MKNIVLFASGNGSNAENIIKYFSVRSIASVSTIITNNPKAGVIERASKYAVNTWVIAKSDLDNSIFLKRLKDIGPDIIVLAGFLLKIPEVFIKEFEGKIVNIHPSLLPKYGGKGMYGDYVHQAVIAGGESQSGISIHFVNKNYDEGKIISQHTCSVLQSDDADSLADKIHQLEYEYYPKVIEKILTNGEF